VRTFGVEEELLLVDAVTLDPLPAGEWAVDLHEQAGESPAGGHRVASELQQEQLEIIGPPRTTLTEQLETIRQGRALADVVAARVGGRAVALPTAPSTAPPHVVPAPRCLQLVDRFGLTAREQLTNGFHVHVAVESREEGVAVLDRIRVWLPALLALSSNSPFWQGADSGYSSYRYQAWSRWPSAGPNDVLGSAEAYDRYVEELLASGVPLDAAQLYFDARLSHNHPTVEVRVADVCLRAEHAAVLAALVRALVETAAREWRAGVPPLPVRTTLLRAWMWEASRSGVEGQLVSPRTGTPVPAGDVVTELLELVRPVLAEYGEEPAVEAVLTDVLRDGSGARRQREAHRRGGDLRAVLADALEQTRAGARAAEQPRTGADQGAGAA
jgi:carboxylate-amine ligase